MKKLLTILVTLSMLLGAFALATYADEPVNYDDHLVTYWDFEGDTPYADKATKGTSSDTLTPGGTVDVADGVASVSNVASKMTAAGGEGTDLYSLKNKTVIVKITVPTVLENKKNGCNLMQKTNAVVVGLNNGGTLTLRSFAGEGNDFRLHNTTDAESWSEAETAYRYIAISYAYDEATGAYNENYYISNTDAPETGADWVLIKNITGTLTDDAQKAAYLTNASDLTFGPNGNDRRNSISYEEIRIYDVAIAIDATGEFAGEDESDDNTDDSQTPSDDNTDNTPNTTEPNTTESKEPAQTTDAPAQTTALTTDATDDTAEEKGCGAVVGAASVALISLLAGTVAVKKKED